jgi:hypothetical protein
MSLANLVSIALMLCLFGGVVYFLFQRRSRWTKISSGTPAVLQPRAGAPSGSLPSTLNEGPIPSWFREQPEPSDRPREDDLVSPRVDRPTTEVRPASKASATSPIIELHFLPEQQTESSKTGRAPLVAAVTEADVVEEKKDWPASA